MKIKLKEKDSYIEVDTELSNEVIDTYEREITIKKDEDLEDTIEFELNTEKNDETSRDK